MPLVERSHLATFLKGYSETPSLVTPAMELLELLYFYAESGMYELAPRSEVLGDKLQKALGTALGRKVDSVIQVPYRNPMSKPDWMGELAFRNSVEAHFQSLASYPGIELARPVAKAPRGADHLEHRLRTSLWNALDTALQRCFTHTLGRSATTAISVNMIRVVHRHLSHVLLGDRASAVALEGVIRLFPRIIPLSAHAEKLDTWIALVQN